MKTGPSLRTIAGAVGTLAVVAALLITHWYLRLRAEAIRWDQAKEIVSQSIEKQGDVWRISIDSLIDRPALQVWEALKQPERSHEFIDTFRKSELVEESENRKVVRLQAQMLTLPAISIEAEFRFDDEHLRATMRSIGNAPQQFDTTYEVMPSPAGDKALVRYRGEVRNRVRLPLADNVQRGAIQELFVKTVRAIRAGIEQTEKEAREAAVTWNQADEIQAETIEHRGNVWTVSFQSHVAAPLDGVWQALRDPQGWSGSSQALQSIRVEQDEPARKLLQMRVRLLALPPQQWRAEVTYDEAARSARIRTLGGRLQDLDATYRLQPDPSGGTRIDYQAVATDRVALTLPEDTQRAAIRQLFAETIRGLERVAAARRQEAVG
jgi:carbon monoxide dehydrogenase subunit G